MLPQSKSWLHHAPANGGSGEADPPDVDLEGPGLVTGNHQVYLADASRVERWCVSDLVSAAAAAAGALAALRARADGARMELCTAPLLQAVVAVDAAEAGQTSIAGYFSSTLMPSASTVMSPIS